MFGGFVDFVAMNVFLSVFSVFSVAKRFFQ